MKKVLTAILLLPTLAFAQVGGATLTPINNINDVSIKLQQFGNLLIYFLIALAVIMIIYNVVMYIVKGGDAAEKTAALKNVGWGILGLAIILSIWGLVNVVTGTVKTNPPAQTIPKFDSAVPTIQ